MKYIHPYLLLGSLVACLLCACDEGVIPVATLEESMSSVDGSVIIETDMMLDNQAGFEFDQSIDTRIDMLPQVRSMSRFEISVNPAREVYRIGQTVNLIWRIYDLEGQVMSFDRLSDQEKENLQANITWSSDDAVTMQINAHQAELTWVENGIFQMEICIQEQCKARSFYVDDALVNIEVSYPTQGAMLSLVEEPGNLGLDIPQINIQGVVQSALLEELDVTINGVDTTLDTEGYFDQAIAVNWGLNHVLIEVNHRIDATQSIQYIDFLWSPYYNEVTDQGVSVTSALQLQVDQALFDQGPYPQLSAVLQQLDPQGSHLEISSLAQLIEVIFSVIDTASLIDTSTLFNPEDGSDDTASFSISSVDLGIAEVDFLITEQGLELILALPQVRLQTQGVIEFSGSTLSLDGSINISLLSSIEFIFSIDDLFQVEVGESNIVIESLTADFDADGVEALINAVSDQILASIQDQFTQVIDDTLRTQLAGFVSSALQGLFGDLRESSIEIPNPLQDTEPTFIQMSLFPTAFENNEEEWARFTLQLDLTHPEPLSFDLSDQGVIKADLPSYSPMQGNGFIAELSLDLLNALFHEVWRTNIFNTDIPIPAELNSFVYAASIQALLPPVIVPSIEGAEDPLHLQIGAMIVDLQLTEDAEKDQYLLTVQSGLSLGLDQGAFTFNLAEQPDITVHLLKNHSGEALSASLLEVVITNTVWSELRTSLTSGIDFALSTFEVDADALSQFSNQVQSLSITTEFDPAFILRDHILMAQGFLSMSLILTP